MKLVQELAKLNTQAAERLANEEAVKKATETAQEQAYQQEAKNYFENVVKPACIKAANANLRSVKVSDELQIGLDTLGYTELDSLYPNTNYLNRKLDSRSLKKHWKYLYELCVAEGLTPNVWQNTDGVGIRDWYEFEVTW